MVEHKLYGNGAAFTATGEEVNPGSTTGVGSARCYCGWLSEELETGAARRKAFKEHKGAAQSEELLLEFEAHQSEDDTTAEEVEEVEAAEEAEAEDDTTAEAEKAAVTVGFQNAPKHYWLALREGTKEILSRTPGVDAVSTHKMTITVEGDSDVVDLLMYLLPALWSDANIALKQWKKDDPTYRSYPQSEKWGHEEAYKKAQEFLISYCAGQTL